MKSKIILLQLFLISTSFCGFLTSKRGQEIYNVLKKIVPNDIIKPEENPLRDYTLEELKSRLNKFVDYRKEPPNRKTLFQSLNLSESKVKATIPDSFDFRTEHKECTVYIKDQAHCGSCWAFGASSALGYRFCQASKGLINLELSPQYLVDCEIYSSGCNGGYERFAYEYIDKHGITTEECQPYISHKGISMTCSDECTSSANAKFVKFNAKVGDTLYTEDEIKYALMTGGPVTIGFLVYEDFYFFNKDAIYKHRYGELLGGHAVTLLGWGVENGTKYFILQNSWGKDWLEGGIFKMAIGECEMLENGSEYMTPIIE